MSSFDRSAYYNHPHHIPFTNRTIITTNQSVRKCLFLFVVWSTLLLALTTHNRTYAWSSILHRNHQFNSHHSHRFSPNSHSHSSQSSLSSSSSSFEPLPQPLAYELNDELPSASDNTIDNTDNNADDDDGPRSNAISLEDDSEMANSGNTSGDAINDGDCPRKREEAVIRGRTCLRKCNSHQDCISTRKRCLCDGQCGLSCVRPDLSCDELGEVSNGRLNLGNGNFFNSRVTYHCDPGYFMSGLRLRTCQGDGSWSDLAPECKPRPLCGPAPNVPHSKHSMSESTETEFELNTTLTFECFNGYEVNGTVEAVCTHQNGTSNWVGPNLRCDPISCGDPGDIENGYRESTGHVFTSRVNYFCNEGYVLSGRAIRYCQSNGQWSGDLPTCQPVKCAQPEELKNGRAFYAEYEFGSVVTYQCERGYQLYGPSNRTCQANRLWSDDDPQCKIIDCGPLGIFPNGYIEAHSTTIGSEIKFFCFDGMIYEGAFNTSTCSPNGTWDPWPFPRCMAPCVVPKITNGRVLNHAPLSKLTHRTAINVSCINDYELFDQEEPNKLIECANGTWSQLPKCVPARCKTLPSRPKHGLVIAPKTDHGMRAAFRCRDGFLLEGSNVTWCHFGKWNVSTPQCTQIYCPFPGYIENGKVMLVGHMGMYDYRPYVRRVGNSKQILYECDKGYSIIAGPPGSTCVDGQWSPSNLPTCERFYHPFSVSRWNRSLRRKLNNNNTHLPSYHHHRSALEHFFAGRRHKRHQQSRYKSSCFHLPDPKPWTKISIVKIGKMENGSTILNDTYPHGTRVRLQCDDGYVLSNPNRTLIKCAKGKWKPELPDCLPAPCITPTIPNGKFWTTPVKLNSNRKSKVILLEAGQLVPHGSQIDLVCQEGYHHGTHSPILTIQLKCSYGSWDSFASSSSNCVPMPCQLPHIKNGGYLNGQEPGQMVEHDAAVKYSCDYGYRRSIDPERLNPDEEVEPPNLKCLLGKLEPELPLCVNLKESPGLQNLTNQSLVKNKTSTDHKSHTSCRSPQKIENALRYFGELFTQRLHLIGIAQFDPHSGQPLGWDTRTRSNESMPFQYEHGTEIIFRCVSYSGLLAEQDPRSEALVEDNLAPESISTTTTQTPMDGTTTSVPERSTWIIKCENRNWIGRSFECEDDFTTQMPESKAVQPNPSHQLSSSIDMRPCYYTSTDPNVWIFNGSDQSQITNWSRPLAHDTLILIRCRDIGKYSLFGPREQLCQDGTWTNEEEITTCTGLNQEYDYDENKAPTILFRHQLGPIAQTADGKLMVYPGTILHLECLWKRKNGTPHWSWSHTSRTLPYEQHWSHIEQVSSLEYRLTLFHAKERDSGVYTCQTPRSHSHSVEIQVKAVHCPSLHNLNSLVRVSANSNDGDRLDAQVQFSCPLGTTLEGSSMAICMPSGQWSNPMPRCIVTECSDLSKHRMLQSITTTTSTTTTATATNESTTTVSSTTDCPTETGVQTIKIIPAEIQQPHNHKIGDKVIFTCPRGYGLQGIHHELHCLESGQWSGPVPFCQEVQCTVPQVPENGFMEGLQQPQKNAIYYAGDIVQFGCVEGFMLDGNPISICQENGRWSGPRAYCTPACTYPGLAHGARLMSEVRFFYPVNETIDFECVEGYEMRGNAAIKCIDSGRWSGSIPECISVK